MKRQKPLYMVREDMLLVYQPVPAPRSRGEEMAYCKRQAFRAGFKAGCAALRARARKARRA